MAWNEDEYIKRLKLLRMMHGGETQEAFAERLGIPFSRWNEYERGYAIPTKTILLIRERIAANITDWILFGDRSVLTANFDEQLRLAEQEMQRQRKGSEKATRDKQRIIDAELRRVKSSGKVRKRQSS